MKTKTVTVEIVYEISGLLTLQLPSTMTLEAMQQLMQLKLENEGFNEDTKEFKLKHRDYSADILAVTDGES